MCSRDWGCETHGWKMLHHHTGGFLLSDWKSAASDTSGHAAFIAHQPAECGFLGWELLELFALACDKAHGTSGLRGGKDKMKRWGICCTTFQSGWELCWTVNIREDTWSTPSEHFGIFSLTETLSASRRLKSIQVPKRKASYVEVVLPYMILFVLIAIIVSVPLTIWHSSVCLRTACTNTVVTFNTVVAVCCGVER